MIAGHADRSGRLERIHHADHVRRPELGVDEPGQLSAHGHARPAAHVVVVEKDRKEAHIVSRRLGLLVEVVADLLHRLLDRIGGAAVELDQLDGVDFLELVVLEDLEVGGLQIRHRIAGLVRDDDVDADVVDAGAEDGRLRGRLRSRGRLLRGCGRLLLLSHAARLQGEKKGGAGGKTRAHPHTSY